MYRAPEVMLEYNKFNNKIDMWSLGCIIYEMVTKIALFRGKNVFDQLYRNYIFLGNPKIEFLKKCSGSKKYFNFTNDEDIEFTKEIYRYNNKPSIENLDKIINPKLKDLINLFLTWDPQERITIRNAFNHEFFDI